MRVLELAGRQQFHVSRDQLLACGFSPPQIVRRLKTGWLTLVHSNVYRVVPGRPTFEGRAVAATLAVPHPGALTDLTAARLTGLRGSRSHGGISLVVPATTRPRLTGVRVHRSTTLDAYDVVTTREGFRVTRPERTLIGCAAEVRPEVLARLVDAAILDGLTTTERLWIYLTRYGGRGCPGSAALKRLLLDRDPRARPSQSTLEDEWIEALGRRGITGMVKQFMVMTIDGPKFIDLAKPEFLAGLDFDSRIWHSSEEDYRIERRRRYVLALAGWLLHPVTEFDLHERVDDIVADIETWPETFLSRVAAARMSVA